MPIDQVDKRDEDELERWYRPKPVAKPLYKFEPGDVVFVDVMLDGIRTIVRGVIVNLVFNTKIHGTRYPIYDVIYRTINSAHTVRCLAYEDYRKQGAYTSYFSGHEVIGNVWDLVHSLPDTREG